MRYQTYDVQAEKQVRETKSAMPVQEMKICWARPHPICKVVSSPHYSQVSSEKGYALLNISLMNSLGENILGFILIIPANTHTFPVSLNDRTVLQLSSKGQKFVRISFRKL